MKQNPSPPYHKSIFTAGSLRWLPAVIALGVLSISLGLYRSLAVRENDQIREVVKASAIDIRDDIKDGMESSVLSLVRMARRWEAQGRPSEKEWESDTGLYLENYAGYQAIEWIDPLFHAQWVVASKGNKGITGFDPILDEAQKAALVEAMNKRQARLSPPLDLPHGKGFMAYVPIFSGKGFDGFIAGIFSGQDLIGSYIHEYHKKDYSIAISIKGEEIYRRYDSPQHDMDLGQDMEINQYDVAWRVRVWPKAEYLSKMRSPLPEWTLLMGIITSFILASTVYFAQAKHQREKDIESSNERLKDEIAERKYAEDELSQYRDHLEELVEVRTTELKELNRQLKWEISVRKAAEEAVEKHALALERSNAELEQFAYVASHDLQEPLRIVAGYTRLLARRYKGKLDQDADEFISYAVDGANRMQTLINDLLKYSRAGARSVHLARVDCEHIFNRTLVNLKAVILERGAVTTHDPLPAIAADATQMEQLFTNLISNAIKYNNENQPKVHVSAARKEKEWLFSVQDNGIGIDPKYHDRIFVIFQRLHGKAEYSGTGIGLAICKKVVENHGGRIWVDSETGKGSIFYFTIPHREVKDEQST